MSAMTLTVDRVEGRRGLSRAPGLLAFLVLLAAALSGRLALGADAKAESSAQEAIEKAAGDYQGKALGRALYRLGKALRACGKDGCADATVAALVRDIASIHLRQRDKKGAARLFARALALAPTLELNPVYDTPEVRAAWEEAGGGKRAVVGPGPEPPAPAPFAHTAAVEHQANVPLPIFAEGGGDGVARVTLTYRGASMGEWREMALERVGSGWGGVIPCADVTLGTMRYFIEGFDALGARVAVGGDALHPFELPVRPAISSEAAHLPGAAPPKSCAEAAPFAPTLEAEQAQPPPHHQETARPRLRRFWFGVAGAVDFMNMPAGDDLCRRNVASGRPINANNLYCTTLDGADFPPASVSNGVDGSLGTGPGQGGHSDGGLRVGNVRVLGAFDYALMGNWLVGARVGAVLNRYRGNDAVNDKRAFGSSIHAELRLTWVYGRDPLVGSGVAPLLYLSGGISEFDARIRSGAVIIQGVVGSGPQRIISLPVDIWRTDGPGFAAAGVGLRVGIRSRLAVVPALRSNLAFGDNGVVAVFGPELTVQAGF
jgi:hypothetical protein